VPEYPWEHRLGAFPTSDGITEFRVWAPRAATLALRASGRLHHLDAAGFGIYEAHLPVSASEDYEYVVQDVALPDPCTRWQPAGLRGPSRIVDTNAFIWTDGDWQGVPPAELVIYELHVGTFTPEGTFDAAIPHLRELRDLGITAIELMPVAEFPGRHGWGYDGVYLNAAHSAYGGPLALQRLVDAAHREGLGVILDVVYNHLGASGVQAMEAYGPYFTDKYSTFWGKAINYDDEDCDPVREWVLQSAEGWVRDFHLDGLRLDAIHAIFDQSPEHIVAAVARRVHEVAPRALVIAESGMNDPKVMRRRERCGWGCDAAWADDFHHALRVLLTGDRDGYYEEFGDVAQLAKAFHRPHVHDGQYSTYRKRRFGAPANDVPPERFVIFCQDHDQVGNRAFGDRLPEPVRPLAAFCTLLAPFTPMLFMGEEYGEPAPFQFFCDHIDEEIATATREGRRKEFARFAQFAEDVPDPQDPATFERSKLTRQGDSALHQLYARLLEARRALGPGDADEIACDEDERWLRVRRGEHTLWANFSTDRELEVRGTLVVAAGAVHESEGALRLAPLAGALVR
jgi:maltooligosyltrehalose trehalohydrolase